ncbi:DNA polymerase III subunit epsilon [Erythrobacter arachoides]|uniref:DNA polymerase III subunit epsilon n=1 Tax=Aurantiacibacter arachoides TaxID=1850444 RepID=A0A844ZYY6_9SPHN|nr:3'-5' exonuclease [Aurantiacibacter arachoides]MXO92146.1 DNA polymerase III subunit epsilon [Aurantiacibacter arachoides]GGD59328.1 DNA polymerase III subunit epsilon [Aurantiacibacter arachoides]
MNLLDRLRATFSASGATPAATPELEELAAALEQHTQFRVLRALDERGHVEVLRTAQVGERVGVVIDTETTGFDASEDQIIEIAMQRFLFTAAGEIRQIERVQSWLEDPGRSLPTRIAQLTRLSDAALSGQRFDDAAIRRALANADLVIAHNAGFDRPFLDQRFPDLTYRAWACSLSQLDWLELGFDGRALGHLVLQNGRFFDGHRAANDVVALTSLLCTAVGNGRPILAHLLSRCMSESIRISAIGAPFEAKDLLKRRGYRWDAAKRHWWRELDTDNSAEERAWLDETIYRGRGAPRVDPIHPRDRFASTP